MTLDIPFRLLIDLLVPYIRARAMPECPVCGDTTFDEVDGFFFCSTCHTQSQVREGRQDDVLGLCNKYLMIIITDIENRIYGCSFGSIYNTG